MKQMHVAMVVSEYPPDSRGIGYFVEHLAEGLLGHGFRVSVITRGSSFVIKKKSCGGIDVYRAPFFPFSPFGLTTHGIFVERLLHSINPDIVHLHTPMVPFLDVGVPRIATIHGVTKYWIKNLYPIGKNPTSLYRRLLLPIYSWYERRSLQKADMIVYMTEKSKKELASYHFSNLIHIPNGSSLDLYKKQRRKKRVLFVGQMILGKGAKDLFEAIKIISSQVLEWEFLFIGNGYLLSKLKRLAKRYRLRNVFFLSQVDHGKISDYYNSSEILVLPSYAETMPNVLLEGMACKMALVASHLEGNKDFLEEGKNVLFITPGDIGGIAKALLRLIKDVSLRRKMGQENYQLIKNVYNWETITKQYIRAYRSLMKK